MAGNSRGRTSAMRKGTILIQASPSKVSTVSAGGSSGAMVCGGMGQWAKSRSRQLCVITHGPDGSGHRRCWVWSRIESRISTVYRTLPLRSSVAQPVRLLVPTWAGIMWDMAAELTLHMLAQSWVIAKGNRIRDVQRLVTDYGGRPARWVKKSSPRFERNRIEYEHHWYEHAGIGRVELKLKEVKR